jgi:hypothetical protein
MEQPLNNLAIILAARSSAGSDDDIPMWAIMTIAFVIIFIIAAATYDPKKWYGRMKCNRCAYQWTARRTTPPARCPKCSSNGITTVNGW